MAQKIPFVWTNDDITVGKKQSMQGQMAFLDKHGVKGTFFIVPRPRGGKAKIGDDPQLVELLKEAVKQGHEIQQHSVTHACIENGTADLRMYDLMGDQARLEYSTHRFLHERLWDMDMIQPHIQWGQQAWIEAFGEPSPGYRPGCGAFCANMYKALENLGFDWCSARLVSMTGWMWASKKYDYPVRFDGPAKPFRQGKLMEFPILDDVAFRIPEEKINDLAQLGWDMWEMCVERNDPFVLVSHPFALEHDEGTGYAIHDKLIPRILETGLAEPMTMNEYYKRVQAGEFPMVPDEERYPDGSNLPEWHALSKARAKA